VPPWRRAFFFGAAFFAAAFAFGFCRIDATFRAGRRPLAALGRLALEAEERRLGADALLLALPAFRGAARLTAFCFFWVFAFRTGFLAIPDSLSVSLRGPRYSAAVVRGGDLRRLTGRP
jgi:hypothetical protein